MGRICLLHWTYRLRARDADARGRIILMNVTYCTTSMESCDLKQSSEMPAIQSLEIDKAFNLGLIMK